MTIAFHPDISTLMAFSAGTLEEPYAVVVATHVAMCEACREQKKRIDTIGGAVLASAGEAAMSPGALDRLLARADDSIELTRETSRSKAAADSRLPAPLASRLAGGLESVRWRWSGPGVSVADLPVSPGVDGRLMLLRVAGGRPVPEHSHGGQELTLILQGAYQDRFGRFGVGDIADHDEDVEHQPIAEAGQDCICLVAVDARLSFRNRVIRALQPFFGL